MANLTETFDLPLSCQEERASLTLFKNITNGKEIKDQVMKGNIDAALIKPTMIIDNFHVLQAATKARHAKKMNKMTTKTLPSEILFCLSPTKNISDCFKKFGFDKSDQSILVAEIHKTGESNMTEICDLIKGENISLSSLEGLSNLGHIKKAYKIKEEELSAATLQEAVTNRIASKDIISYS